MNNECKLRKRVINREAEAFAGGCNVMQIHKYCRSHLDHSNSNGIVMV